MAMHTLDTSELLQRAKRGDRRSVDELLDRHRPRLRQMIALRMDARVRQRCDPSDVIQETLAEAARKLSGYLQERPLPFYPWLRRIAWEQVVDLHRRHFAQQRNVASEQQWRASDESATTLAERLAGGGTGPGRQAIRKEMASRVRESLQLLSHGDRDVLLMRYAEQLQIGEIAALLEISESAAKSRVRRALERLQRHLDASAKDTS